MVHARVFLQTYRRQLSISTLPSLGRPDAKCFQQLQYDTAQQAYSVSLTMRPCDKPSAFPVQVTSGSGINAQSGKRIKT